MHYLVTGGAGYIGSHIVRALINRGDTATILDNFSTGHRWATQDQEVIEHDLRDLHSLSSSLNGRSFDGVFHFAAKSLVSESNLYPLMYYQNNVCGTANIIELAINNKWKRLVLSSTAAVYGNPAIGRIDENHPKNPINVYGKTKLCAENMLEVICGSHNLSAVCLRYFNAAGASRGGGLGERHEPETHLIPNILRAARGYGPTLNIFGIDYPTKDGTCIRDYIHVDDLAEAHLLAMEVAGYRSSFEAYNLGNGNGFSVIEVIEACERVVGKKIHYAVGHRRPGDPSKLVADSSLARKLLGWTPNYTSIDEIVHSAWQWEQEVQHFSKQ